MLIKLEPQVQQRLGLSTEEIVQFCQQWNIIEFALFGSVLSNQFHPNSDIDRAVPNYMRYSSLISVIGH